MDTQPPADRENDVKSAYPEVFTGLDKLEGYKAHVHVDPDITLVAQPLHRDLGPLQHSQMPQAPWSSLGYMLIYVVLFLTTPKQKRRSSGLTQLP